MAKKLSVAITRFNKKLANLSPSEKFKINAINLLVEELFLKYELEHYKFKYGYGWKYKGMCTNTTITLALNFALKGSMEEIKNTLLHEIAHALVGSNVGHRLEWQDKAKELGVTWSKNYHK